MIKLIRFLKKNQIGALTLAELLTSLAILSIVISAVYGFLIQGIDIFKFSEAQTNVQRQARIAFTQLTKDIKGGYSVTAVDDYSLEIWGMSVNRGEMEWTGVGNTYQPTEASHHSWISEPIVYVNGNPRSDSTYTVNYAQGNITFTSSPPPAGDTVTADYTYRVTIEYSLDPLVPPPNQFNDANLVREVTDFNGNSTTNILVRHIRNRNSSYFTPPQTSQRLFDDVSPTRIRIALIVDDEQGESPREFRTETEVAFKSPWTPTSTTNAPTGRSTHTAVWTGSRMIVWGGFRPLSGQLNTGGIYDPATDTWTPTSLTNAPSARNLHTAIWTGTRMIVWGGWSGSSYLNTGGIYDPTTNSWTPTSLTNAPSARNLHTAIWTGTRMIVWGGWSGSSYLNTGGIYDPVTDSWQAGGTSLINAPSARENRTAVWTGSRMIIWGGRNSTGYLNTGGIYDPVTDSWQAGGTSTFNAPSARSNHTAIWTGSRMIVWGGWSGSSYLNTGGIYDPTTNSWTPTSLTNAPSARNLHTAIWTGTRMIVWGGRGGGGTFGAFNTGGIYDSSTNSWMATSTTNAPSRRYDHTAIWTGTRMIVWGGWDNNGNYLNTGGVYDPP